MSWKVIDQLAQFAFQSSVQSSRSFGFQTYSSRYVQVSSVLHSPGMIRFIVLHINSTPLVPTARFFGETKLRSWLTLQWEHILLVQDAIDRPSENRVWFMFEGRSLREWFRINWPVPAFDWNDKHATRHSCISTKEPRFGFFGKILSTCDPFLKMRISSLQL